MGDRRVRGAAATAMVLTTLVFGLSGCAETEGPAKTGEAGTAADQPGQPGARTGGGRNEKPGTPNVGEPARTVIHTGQLRVEVDDVAAAADEAVRLTARIQGYVGSDERDTGERTAQARVRLRIPAEHFTSTLNQLAKLGKELHREIAAEDVSEAVVDLDTRIATMRASVKRTRALLDRAQNIGEIAEVERELSSRETELATLESRRRNLANRVAYSTITATFVTDAAPPPAEVGFISGLKAGWHAFQASVRMVLLILGVLLPFLIAVAVPVTAIVWLRRRFRRPGVPAPAPGPATAQPGPRTPL